jgi:glucokinase
VPLLQEGGFMQAFLVKGSSKYLSEIPVKVVMDESAPLLGAAQYPLVL